MNNSINQQEININSKGVNEVIKIYGDHEQEKLHSDENRINSNQDENIDTLQKAYPFSLNDASIITSDSLSEPLSQKKEFFIVCINLIKASFPSAMTMFLNYASFFIAIIAAGRSKNSQMEAVLGLSNVWISGFASFIIISFADALAIFSSRAYGHKDYILVGEMLYKGYFLCFVSLTLSVCTLLYNSYAIFKMFGFEEEISFNSAYYIKCMIPALYLQGIYETTKSFFNAQGIFEMPMIIKAFNLVIYSGLIELFIIYLGYEFGGVAAAMLIMEFLNALFIIIYLLMSKSYNRSTLVKFNFSQLFLGLKDYLGEALEIAGIWYIEILASELSSIMAGRMHNEAELAAYVSQVNIAYFISIGALGLSFSTRTYISNYVGEGNLKKVQQYAIGSYFLCSLFCLLEIAVILIFKKQIIHLFTQDNQVSELMSPLISIYLLNVLNENFVQIHATILKAFGKETTCLIFYLFSFIVLGLPLSYLLCFQYSHYALGIFAGLIAADTLCCLLLGVSVIVIDWGTAMNEVQKHLIAEIKAHNKIESKNTSTTQTIYEQLTSIKQKKNVKTSRCL